MNDSVKPPQRFGAFSVVLFSCALLWFGICLNWQLDVGLMLLGTSIPACVGLVAGLVGLLPGNSARLLAAIGAMLNGAGLFIVLDRWLLWGI